MRPQPGKWCGSDMVLETAKGLFDYYSRQTNKFYPWGFAMNGMTSRLEAVRQTIFRLKIEHIVETGTYRGTTAEWLAQFGLPLETIEISERFCAFSRARLSKFKNAKVFLDSSVSFLTDRVAQGRVAPDALQLFYLDSHWQDYLPLREELQIIFKNYGNSVVVIDDFEVVDDEGYGFDRYAPDKELTLNYLMKCDLPKLNYFYPSTRSSEETGAKRGWIVLTSNPQRAEQLRTVQLLREHLL